jgi:hypothetical protein
MKKMKRMNMGGLPSQANAMARSRVPGMNPNGMGSQARAMAQAPNRTGGIGKQMSAMARAQNRPAPPVMPAPPLPAQAMKTGGRVKRMNDGGVAPVQTTAAPKGRTRMSFRDNPQRYERKVSRISQRFPGYAPTLESPVDTRDEYRTYKRGFRDWRKANPDVKPVRPEGRGNGGMRGLANALSRREGNLERFKSKMQGMAKNPKFADMIAKKQKMIDSFRSKVGSGRTAPTPMPVPPMPTMKAGGLVKANGCAQRGKSKGRMV